MRRVDRVQSFNVLNAIKHQCELLQAYKPWPWQVYDNQRALVELDYDWTACCGLNLWEKLVPLLPVITGTNEPIVGLENEFLLFVNYLLLLFKGESFLELRQANLYLNWGNLLILLIACLWESLWSRHFFFLVLNVLRIFLSL